MASKLFQLAAIASLAILSISLGAEPVSALSLHGHSLAHRHDNALLAHKKRQTTTRRCRPRPTSSSSSGSASASPTSSPTQAPAPAPTTTQAPPPPVNTPAPPPPPPPSSGGGGKVGIAWANGNNVNSLGKFKTSKVSTYYTWSAWPVTGASQLGFQFIPMLWGRNQVTEFKNNVKPGQYKAAFGFNEPDHSGQAFMSVGEAVGIWWNAMQPLKNSGYTLISPATTSNLAVGLPWLKDFVNQCGGCSIDAIAVHYYGTDPNAFIQYLQLHHTTFGKPLYVTEWACQDFSGQNRQCSAAQVSEFMRVATDFMDNTDWVVAYYAFGVLQNMGNVNPLNQLINSSGGPNALGAQYIN